MMLTYSNRKMPSLDRVWPEKFRDSFLMGTYIDLINQIFCHYAYAWKYCNERTMRVSSEWKKVGSKEKLEGNFNGKRINNGCQTRVQWEDMVNRDTRNLLDVRN